MRSLAPEQACQFREPADLVVHTRRHRSEELAPDPSNIGAEKRNLSACGRLDRRDRRKFRYLRLERVPRIQDFWPTPDSACTSTFTFRRTSHAYFTSRGVFGERELPPVGRTTGGPLRPGGLSWLSPPVHSAWPMHT